MADMPDAGASRKRQILCHPEIREPFEHKRASAGGIGPLGTTLEV
jgi:hypothetical protein